MHKVICPHCKARGVFAARPPKDVVVVMPCPSCNELVVLFREKAIAVSRKIIEHGTRDERRAHYADIIDEFLGENPFSPVSADPPGDAEPHGAQDAAEQPDSAWQPPITQEEFDRFLKIDLKCIDNPTYFRRHFG